MAKEAGPILVFLVLILHHTSFSTEPHKSLVCENSRLHLSCGDGESIVVLAASYGRSVGGNESCPHSNIRDLNCHASGSLRIVKQQCEGKSSCSVVASNGVFGDPCVHTYKYLEVVYDCSIFCEDKSNFYGPDAACDLTLQCTDGSDERNCDYEMSFGMLIYLTSKDFPRNYPRDSEVHWTFVYGSDLNRNGIVYHITFGYLSLGYMTCLEVAYDRETGVDDTNIVSFRGSYFGYPDDVVTNVGDIHVNFTAGSYDTHRGFGISLRVRNITDLSRCNGSNEFYDKSEKCDHAADCTQGDDERFCNFTLSEGTQVRLTSKNYPDYYPPRSYVLWLFELAPHITNPITVVYEISFGLVRIGLGDMLRIGSGWNPQISDAALVLFEGNLTGNPNDTVIPAGKIFVEFRSSRGDREGFQLQLSVLKNLEHNPCDNQNTCPEDSRCVLTPTSPTAFACKCPPGYILLEGATSSCANVNECVDDTANACSENAVCRDTVGSYDCSCRLGYEGDGFQCSLPVSVTVHPGNYTVDLNTTVELTCEFRNARQFQWFKDGRPIPQSVDQSLYVIQSATAHDSGYYSCVAQGLLSTAETYRGSIYIRGLTNIAVSNARFNIIYTSELASYVTREYRQVSTNITNFLEHGLQRSLEFDGSSPSVVVGDLSEGSVVAAANIYSLFAPGISAFEQDIIVTQALSIIANSSSGYFDASSIGVLNKAICFNVTWTSPRYGPVTFPHGEIGDEATSSGVCPFNTTNAGEAVGKALCAGDFISQSSWQPADNCGPVRNVTDLLTELSQSNLSAEAVDEVSMQTVVVTSNNEEITAADITLVAKITSGIANTDTDDVAVTISVTNIVNNIAAVAEDVLQTAEEENGAVSDLVEAFERQLSNVDVSEEPVTITMPNVAVQIQSLPTENVQQDLQLRVLGSNREDLTNSLFDIRNVSDNEGKSATEVGREVIAQVVIPYEVSSGVSKLTFITYRNSYLFVSLPLRELNQARAGLNRTVNTPVFSLTLGDSKITNVNDLINFTFIPLEPGMINPRCVFWNTTLRDWSSDGCKVVSSQGIKMAESNDNPEYIAEGNTTDERIVCGCTHLTNFAVLMDVHYGDPTDNRALRVLSIIGCAMSIAGLLMTLGTYLSNKKIRSKQHQQILICLCSTLLCLYVSFLAMIVVDATRRQAEVSPGPCGLLTALIHFFVLSAIAWMGVEGYNTYLVIVKIFDSYVQNFMRKAAVVAWGGPFLIVILTGAIARERYARTDFCFLQLWSQIGGLLIPMAVILFANVVIFVLVVRRLVRSANVAGKVKVKEQERRETIRRVQHAVCILLLLGVTWLTGYLLLIEALSKVAQVFFIIFNCFQGFFIFLLYCVRQDSVRRRWRMACCAGKENGGSTSKSARSFASHGNKSAIRSMRTGTTVQDSSLSMSDFVVNPIYDDSLRNEQSGAFKEPLVDN